MNDKSWQIALIIYEYSIFGTNKIILEEFVMGLSKFVARSSHSSFRFLGRIYSFCNAALSGFWLGVMSEKSLEFSDNEYYSNAKYYTEEKYNMSGFFDWEKFMVEKHFSKTDRILLIAAGGGREVLAFSKMEFKVDSYECNTGLVAFGNDLLEKNNTGNRIKYLQRNSVPEEVKEYDGVIIGWGAYSLIPGKKKRVAFLTALHPFLGKGAPLMISFLWSEKRNKQDRIITWVSNFFRFFHSKEKTEQGDRLMPYFIHYFTEAEVRSELKVSKFTVIDYYSKDYGCLIAVSKD